MATTASSSSLDLLFFADGIPDELPMPNASKKSRKTIDSDLRTLADRPEGRRSEKIRLVDKLNAHKHGALCTCCQKTDNSPDPVTPKYGRLWGYYRKVSEGGYKTEGGTCWYCLRIWNVQFMEVYTLTLYKVELGRDSELHQIHFRYVHWLVKEVSDAVDRGEDREVQCRLQWPEPTTLEHLEIFEVIWTFPKERHLDIEEYKVKFGDPAKNGKGDIVVEGPQGEDLVKLLSEKVWTKTTRIVHQNVKRRILDNGKDEVSGKFIEQRWKACQNIALGAAVASGKKRRAMDLTVTL